MDVPIELCTSAKVYKSDSLRRMLLISLIVALYSVVLPYCYYTAGEPRRLAMIQAQKLADDRWALEVALHPNILNSTGNGTEINLATLSGLDESNPLSSTGVVVDSDGFVFEKEEIVFEFEKKAKEQKEAQEKANMLATDPLFHDEFGEGAVGVGQNGDKKANREAETALQTQSWIMSWFGPSKEQKRAEEEFEKWQKEIEEKSGDTVSLPPEYLPSAWACVALFVTLSAHALFHLLCHWLVGFKARSLFKAASKVEEGCFVLITPPANRGGPQLVPIQKSAVAGGAGAGTAGAPSNVTLFAEFQRQKYIFTPSNRLGENSKKYPNGVFTLTAYPINLPLTHYLEYTGIPTEGEVHKLIDRWGKNHLAVTIPSFLELLQIQLLSPLAIFQVFCAVLWLLDEYWSYTLFTLASVVMYEATTVFQRTRTQQMLGGMSPKPSPIYVYRANKWIISTTKDLLPGDLISLSFKKRAPANKPVVVPTTAPHGANVSNANDSSKNNNNDEQEEKKTSITSKDDIIPCDCVLIRGSAVVNEASLTGESVPQMKEAIALPDKADSPTAEKLDMNGIHRVNTLFSGCSIVTVSGKKKSDLETNEDNKHEMAAPGVPTPPDGGAIAYVLRTGFGSSQGSLLQMIEFSQQTVSGDSKETGLALFMLFVFALMASGYVLKEGLRKKEKTTHELLLRCVIIITSVVPRQFPMQMAVAVNMALMALSKTGIFCTEPYRVPLAGKISHCLFDKTGTITTDQLVPVGLINYNSANTSAGEEEDANTHLGSNIPSLTPVTSACAETAMVLAACHSLVVVEDGDDSSTPSNGVNSSNFDPLQPPKLPSSNLTGDPIELAAIRAIEWSWDGPSSTATPDGALKRHLYGIQVARAQYNRLQTLPIDQRGPTFAKEVEGVETEIKILETKIEQSRKKSSAAIYSSIQVLQRHHFSSALQRMSVVVKCNNRITTGTNKETSSSSSGDHWYCLVKGSPEALKSLITPESLPSWYVETYETLARRGLRVLAMGYKKVSGKDRPQEQPRHWVENNLLFGGFIAFECKIRGDSGIVIQSLRQSDHKVAMLTGDALLTSVHVAKQVGICDANLGNLTLECKLPLDSKATVGTASNGSKPTLADFYWNNIDKTRNEAPETIPFSFETIDSLYAKYNLLTTESIFLGLVNATGAKTSKMWQCSRHFKVFARMSPQGKANIIKSIQDTDKDFHVFMCGDGGNDVGALKQADVGIALLAGHANANTSDELSAADNANEKKDAVATTGGASSAVGGKNAEDVLNEHQKKLQQRNEALNKARAAHMKEFQARYTKEQQIWLQEELKIRTERGEYMAMFTLMKEQAAKIKQAMAEENQRFMAMHGQVWDPKSDGDGTGASKTAIEQLMESMDSGDAGGLAMVRPGDASIAAPFTSRIPSIRAVVDLIRQGRCTLLSALMQQQIMMLESTISAYTLSALSLHNARSSERQMMASSWLIMTAAVSFSYASPVDHMHPLRPLRSLFHPAIIFSILGQAAIHIGCMTLAVKWATDAMGPEKLQEVTEFFRKVKAHEIERDAMCGEDDFVCQMQAYWMAPFMPNLLNSVVFLVETAQMISVFFANYKGRPWMKGMLENHPLFLSVFLCVGGVIVAAWEMIPAANELIQLAPFPDDAFRYKVVFLVIATIMGTFAWDRFCVFLFAPDVCKASIDELKKTTWKDFLPIFYTVLKVAAGLFVLGTGNILLAGLGYYMYRNYSNKQQAQQAAK